MPESELSSLDQHDRLTAQVAPWVAASLARWARTERVVWEVAFQLDPGQQGQPVPVVALFIQVPSPVLGQYVAELGMIEVARVCASEVDRAVRDIVERLLRERSRQLAVVPTNGGRHGR